MEPKPSDLLLHYTYGAAAVLQWGHGQALLKNRGNIPRPRPPAKRAMGPKYKPRDRNKTIRKLEIARKKGQAGGGNAAVGAGGSVVDGEKEKVEWDADDVVLFFWGNTPTAVERRRKREEEQIQRIEQWRRATE